MEWNKKFLFKKSAIMEGDILFFKLVSMLELSNVT